MPNTNLFRDTDSVDLLKIKHLVQQFKSLKLPKAQWTHEAHIIVGTYNYLNFGFEGGLERMRKEIQRYNEATGVKNSDTSGYHESITIFYMRMIATLVNEVVAGKLGLNSPETEIYSHVLNSRLLDKTLLFEYYSKELIFSVTARRKWVPPDRKQV